MSVPYLELDATGTYVIGGGYAPSLRAGMMACPAGHEPSEFMRHYMLDGALTARPAISAPVKIEGGWQIADLPKDTVVEVFDLIGGEHVDYLVIPQDGEVYEFNFSSPGSYMVVANAPDPYTDLKTLIEVP